jgi:hypothetical protein
MAVSVDVLAMTRPRHTPVKTGFKAGRVRLRRTGFYAPSVFTGVAEPPQGLGH